jgi:hypothetical protein
VKTAFLSAMFMPTCSMVAPSKLASAKGRLAGARLPERHLVRHADAPRERLRHRDEFRGEVDALDLPAAFRREIARRSADAAADVEHASAGRQVDLFASARVAGRPPIWNSSTTARSA